MTFSIREYKLAGPEGDGRNPYINARGVFVGDGTPLIEKDPEGRWRPKVRQELEGALSKTCRNFVDMESHIRSLDHVARALNNNDFALANIALVLMKLSPPTGEGKVYSKYDSAQPRVPAGDSDGGQWTANEAAIETEAAQRGSDTTVGPEDVTEIAYNGDYHNQVVADFVKNVRAIGNPIEASVPLTTVDGTFTAVSDVIMKNPITGEVFLLEFKTGDDPQFTDSQRIVYPLASIGQHVFSSSEKIRSFGFYPGEPLPPITVLQIRAYPGKPYEVTPLPPEFVKYAGMLALVSE